MSRPMIRIHNVETDEIIDREMNDEEFALFEADRAKAIAEEKAKLEAETKRTELLERLGLTEEDARLLLG